MASSIKYVESEINVPWGHIAVKAWGDPLDIPVLVMHGIMDNAGSFDPLIPLLPKGHYYFCFDFPGHGKSSSFPLGVPLYLFNYVYSVKLVVEHLSWDKFIVMGHSLGAQISMLYTSLYPERVKRAIFIDGIAPKVLPEDRIVPEIRKYFDSLYDMGLRLKTKTAPSYSYEEAFNRIISSRSTGLEPEAAKNLLPRALIPSGDGYRYSTDQRLKLYLRPLISMEQMRHIVISIKCPCLMIIAQDTYNLLDDISEDLYHERLEILFKPMLNFKFILVKGNHNVHMNNPGIVAPYVEVFLLNSHRSHL